MLGQRHYLDEKVNKAIESFLAQEDANVRESGLLNQMEIEAYAVSDMIPPLYFLRCGRYQ